MEKYQELNEDELIDRLKAGDEVAFTEIYNRYWKVLLNHAQQRLNSRQTAEELLQDIFVSLYLRKSELELRSSLDSYLKTALKYRIFNLYRAGEVRESHQDNIQQETYQAPFTPDQLLEETELRDRIYRAAQKMPEKCRQVFLLSRFEQLSQQEIADRLDISVSTVKKHITKALRILQDDFKDYDLQVVTAIAMIVIKSMT